jgi:hypothetical protein
MLSNQNCTTEHEGERGECAARPNYFLSAKSTPRVHEPLLVPCKIFTLPNDRLQLVKLYQHVVLQHQKVNQSTRRAKQGSKRENTQETL